MSGIANIEARALLANEAPDPFAAIFGTRRGVPESRHLTLASRLGEHGMNTPELSGHPGFYPILTSPLFKHEGVKIARLHLGVSDHFGDMEFAVVLANLRREVGSDVPLGSTGHFFGGDLREALRYGASILAQSELLGPGSVDVHRLSTSFTFEAFDETFEQRLQESALACNGGRP